MRAYLHPVYLFSKYQKANINIENILSNDLLLEQLKFPSIRFFL